MYKNYKISVVMATYNGEKYLAEQLDSIVNQTIVPDEIVVSDDCSNDSTTDILNHYKNVYKNISFIVSVNEHNIGYTKNFAKAMSKVSGNIVFLSDQDDVWFRDKIKKHIDIMEEDKIEFLASEMIDTNDDLKCKNDFKQIKDYKYHFNINDMTKMSFHGMVISFKLNNEYNEICNAIYDERSFCHDRFLSLYFALRANCIYYNKPYTYHRITGENVAGKRNLILPRGDLRKRVDVATKDYILSKFIYELSKTQLLSILDKVDTNDYKLYIDFCAHRKDILTAKLNNNNICENLKNAIWIIKNLHKYPPKVGFADLFFVIK